LGWFVYAIVWLIALQAILTTISVDETASVVLALTTTMTGVSGQALASKTKDGALKTFDHMYPPDS
jgi:hypothetical protein